MVESGCQLPSEWIVVGLVSIIIVMLLGTVGNILVCIVLVKLRNHETSFSSIFVISVSLSDLLTCITVLPFDVVYWAQFPLWILSPNMCKLWNSLFFTFIGCSALGLTQIAADMFIAISHPLHYHIYVTKFRSMLVVVCTWSWCFVLGILIYIFQEEPPPNEYAFDISSTAYGSYLFIHMLIPCVFVSFIYYKLFKVARDHASRIKVHPTVHDQNKNGKDNCQEESVNVQKSAPRPAAAKGKRLGLKEELKLAKTFGLVATMFFVCWTPFFVVQMVYIFKLEDSVNVCSLEIADTVVCWFAYIQCCVNPILYAFRHRSFRRSMLRVCRRHHHKEDLIFHDKKTTSGAANAGYNTD